MRHLIIITIPDRTWVVLLSLLLCCACGENQPGAANPPASGKTQNSIHPHPGYFLSDVRTDSLATYTVVHTYADKFMFSPLRENAVWISGQEERTELYLATGKSKPLQEVLGEATRERFNILAVDAYREKSFFYTNAKGDLIWYSNGAKTTLVVAGKELITAVRVEETGVWISGSSGLAYWDRAAPKAKKIEGLPAGWVYNLDRRPSGKILLNNTVLFDPNTGKWEYDTSDDCKTPPTVWDMNGMHLRRDLHKVIHYTDRNGKLQMPVAGQDLYQANNLLCARHAILWTKQSAENNIMLHRYDFENNTIGELTYPLPGGNWGAYRFSTNGDTLLSWSPEGWIIGTLPDNTLRYRAQQLPEEFRQVDMDSRNVYLLFNNRFMVISLDWLLSEATPLGQYRQENEDFKTASDAFSAEQDFAKKMALFEDIRTRFGSSSNPFVSFKMKNLDFSWDDLDFSDESLRALIESQIAKGLFDRIQQVRFYSGAATYFAKQVNPEKTLVYARKCSTLTGIKNGSVSQKAKTFQHQRDSLKSLRLPDDAYAYAYGVVLENYCSGNDAFESKSMYQLDLAIDQYKRVLAKYPRSNWADDAQYALTQISLFSQCEGGCAYGPEDIRRLEQFEKKYPASNKIPDVWLLISQISSEDALDEAGNIDQARTKLGFSYLLKLKERYPEFTTRPQYKATLSRYLQKAHLFWSFRANCSKKVFRQGQAITVNLNIENAQDTAQVLMVPAASVFFITVEYAPDASCGRINAPFKTTRTVPVNEQSKTVSFPISPGGTRKWTVDLLSQSSFKGRDRSRIGVFDFSKKGNYFIRIEVILPGKEEALFQNLVLIIE